MTTSNPTVWLTLQAHNAPNLIDYYVDTFGFVVAARYGDGDRIDHAQLNWPEGSGGIMLGSHKPGADWSREPGTAGGYVVTSDLDGLYERVLSHEAEIVRPLAKTVTQPGDSPLAEIADAAMLIPSRTLEGAPTKQARHHVVLPGHPAAVRLGVPAGCNRN
jgi:uncharacterized glyoxalase superfamily protein PhnB